jgi:hypothetical protein
VKLSHYILSKRQEITQRRDVASQKKEISKRLAYCNFFTNPLMTQQFSFFAVFFIALT